MAYTHRACMEAIQAHNQRWLAKMLGCRTQTAQRTYRAQPGWKQDPVIAAAPKKIASRYYQLKTGHAAIGIYLQKIQAQERETCQGCQAPKELVHHLLFECRQWQRQQETLYQGLTKTGIARPTMAEEYPGRLLGNPKASQALLQFLADTAIGCPR